MSGFWSKVAEVMGSKPDPNHVWVKVEDNPHAGFAQFSDAEKNPFKKAIKVTGITTQWAKINLTGRVLRWDIEIPKGAIDSSKIYGMIK